MPSESGVPQKRSPSLAEIKKRTLKPVDAWWTVLVIDPIAIRLLWLLVRIFPRTSPNTVTSASLLVGLLAATAFLTKHLAWGALLYQVAFALDCIDGKLARLRARPSTLGAFWDGFVNNLVYGACITAFVAGNYSREPMLVPLGCTLLATWALHVFLTYEMQKGDAASWTAIRPPEGSWLARHRLLPPFTFPDKHAIALTLGPLIGQITYGFAATCLLEVLSMGLKFRTVLRQKQHQ